MVALGGVWDMTRYGDTINERAVRIPTGMHSCYETCFVRILVLENFFLLK